MNMVGLYNRKRAEKLPSAIMSICLKTGARHLHLPDSAVPILRELFMSQDPSKMQAQVLTNNQLQHLTDRLLLALEDPAADKVIFTENIPLMKNIGGFSLAFLPY